MQPNFSNRTLFHGDNLEFLRGMNSGTIHLIATDPPFNKGRDFHATPDSLARGSAQVAYNTLSAGLQERVSLREQRQPITAMYGARFMLRKYVCLVQAATEGGSVTNSDDVGAHEVLA